MQEPDYNDEVVIIIYGEIAGENLISIT